MNYSVFDPRQAQEVVELFANVFAESEGQEEGTLVGNLVSELIATNSDDRVGFVTTDQEKIVAGIFFSRLTFKNNANAFILSPVAVDTNYQGKGIGQQLINFGLRNLKERGGRIGLHLWRPKFL